MKKAKTEPRAVDGPLVVTIDPELAAETLKYLREAGEDVGVRIPPEALVRYLARDQSALFHVVEKLASSESPLREVRAYWSRQAKAAGISRRPWADPDTWPSTASGRAVLRYQLAVIAAAVGVHWTADMVRTLRCTECGSAFRPVTDAANRRPWWVCPKGCNGGSRCRAKVRTIRKAWDWPTAEAEVAAEAENRQAQRDEQHRRLAFRGRIFALGLASNYGTPKPGHRYFESLQRDVCKVAGIEPFEPENVERMHYWPAYRCKGCGKTWMLGSGFGSGPEGEWTGEELRGPVPFWSCPAGCNAKRQAAVCKAARSPLERMLVGPLDAAIVEADRAAERERLKAEHRSRLARDAWARRKGAAPAVAQ